MLKWEYMTIHHERDDSEHDKDGADGWELVTVYYDRQGNAKFIFKRPVSALDDGLTREDYEAMYGWGGQG